MATFATTRAERSKTTAASVQSRVLGWDLLRGLCALSVATYHLLSWLNITDLHPLGLYGVYIFFVLSGASLTFTYGEKFRNSNFSFANFLIARYLRLAPLYILLLILVLPWKLKNEEFNILFIGKLISNFVFSFGLYQPVGQSMLVGGWSLGIEFIFYLLFPLFLVILKFERLALCVFGVLFFVKIMWILETLDTYFIPTVAQIVKYHHLPAFLVYFMGGCILGEIARTDQLVNVKGKAIHLTVQFLAFCLMAMIGNSMTSVLTGWNGIIFPVLCFVLVAYAGSFIFSGPMAVIARSFGNATYGLYLIHPIVYFGCMFFVFPKIRFDVPVDLWSMQWRLIFALCVIVGSYTIAVVLEKYFERPLRSRALSYIKERHLISVR